FLLIAILLAACSSGQVPAQETSVVLDVPTPLRGKPTAIPATQPIDSPPTIAATAATVSIAPPKRKDPLPEDAWKELPVVPSEISDRARAIHEYGLSLGNDPTHFSIIGDCQNVSSYFLSAFDEPDEYRLGEEYAYLQPTIDYYEGSFSRTSLAVKGGFNAAAVISPLRADPKSCNPNESPLDCELRVWRPSVVIVSMETWWSEKPAEEYDKYMRRVLDRIIEAGALPIIATKADNLEGDHSINATIAQIAYEYEIPLWNFWAAVQPLPSRGLTGDGFHLTFARNFFDDRLRMESAWPWRNLTALQTLDTVRNGLSE
ncbi:MAG TPA: hypothetical protein VJ785_09245, partial [Anaerolineales bacterium]|nr:hypothetical protein [Anaerolineales bacterium]